MELSKMFVVFVMSRWLTCPYAAVLGCSDDLCSRYGNRSWHLDTVHGW